MTPIDAESLALTTAAGLALLAEAEAVAQPGPSDLVRWRREAPPEVVSAAVRLAACRRRGSAKFARADRMWLEPTALEQATAEAVARHKAARFASAGRDHPVLDLCCGLGGDAIALATAGPVLAVDLDTAMARRARWNAEVYGAADRVFPVRARAEQIAIPPDARVHIDPDRRARRGPRAKSVLGYEPGLDFLRALPDLVRGGAIKLGPASDFEDHFGRLAFEIELVSLRGECKEATAWFGDLATCRRRATMLPDGATWSDRDAPPDVLAPSAPPAAFVFDPDPALVRSGLLDGFAAAHDLFRLAGGGNLLTGPSDLTTPWLSGFLVRAVLPFDRRRLRRLVADLRLGPLEIKVRGLDILPETLRRQLRPPGPNPATLILAGSPVAGGSVVILADRLPGSH